MASAVEGMQMEDIQHPDVRLMKNDKAFMRAIWEKRLKQAQTIAFNTIGDQARVNKVMDAVLYRNKTR